MSELTESQIERINKIISEVQAPVSPPEPPAPWKPNHGKYYVDAYGRISESKFLPDSNYKLLRNAGTQRTTREECNRAIKRRVYSERLSALACELGGELDKSSDFDVPEESKNSYIYYDGTGSTCVGSSSVYSPERVYMTKDCARQIRKMINSGEVVL